MVDYKSCLKKNCMQTTCQKHNHQHKSKEENMTTTAFLIGLIIGISCGILAAYILAAKIICAVQDDINSRMTKPNLFNNYDPNCDNSKIINLGD